MEDFKDELTISVAGKTHYALRAFLKKHGGSEDDISRFVEEAIVWRLLDREMAFRNAPQEGEVQLFPSPEYDNPSDRLAA